MNEEFRRRLEECGAGVQTALDRFMGNSAIYEKFLKRFPDDPNYSGIGENIQAGNYEEAYKCAHAMKGVTGNLGLDSIYQKISELVEEMRNKSAEEVDKDKVNIIWQDAQSLYDKYCQIIKEYL